MIVIIGALAGVGYGGYVISKFFRRIGDLERRVAFLEDRSPQAQYIRELEDKEKGWVE
jgi:hypothetical protein